MTQAAKKTNKGDLDDEDKAFQEKQRACTDRPGIFPPTETLHSTPVG